MRLLLALLAFAALLGSACTAAAPAPPAVPPQPTPDIQGTVTAAVASTVSSLAAPIAATATAQVVVRPTATIAPAAASKWVIDASRWLGSYPAAVDALADSQAMSALIARDSAALDRLRMAGRVYDVFDGDQVELVESIGSYARVRVIVGNAAGKTVLVPSSLVREVITDRTYLTHDGDTLVTVAQDVYHDPQLWRTIYEANKDVIGVNPDALHGGLKLKIPPKP